MNEKPDSASGRSEKNSPFVTVPIEIVVSVGKARPLIRDLVSLGENDILSLDKRVEDPVDLYVGERLIARGLLEEMEGEKAGQLCVRVTEISDLRNGLE